MGVDEILFLFEGGYFEDVSICSLYGCDGELDIGFLGSSFREVVFLFLARGFRGRNLVFGLFWCWGFLRLFRVLCNYVLWYIE